MGGYCGGAAFNNARTSPPDLVKLITNEKRKMIAEFNQDLIVTTGIRIIILCVKAGQGTWHFRDHPVFSSAEK